MPLGETIPAQPQIKKIIFQLEEVIIYETKFH